MIAFKFLVLLLGSQVSSALVTLEVSVLQYDNPSGTSYHGMNYTGSRKCCDTGGDSSDCSQSKDTCDIFFVFCIGILNPAFLPNQCNGSYIDMSEDVSRDINRINSTKKNSLIRMSTMSWWDEDLINLTANVFDIDDVNKSTGSLDTELVDFFSQPLNITPASDYLSSKSNVIRLLNKISLALELKVWCTPGWYGTHCEKQCNTSTVGSFHDCSINGSVKPANTCSYKDLLVLPLKAKFLDVLPLYSLRHKLVEFIATNVCPRHTKKTTIQMTNIQYKSFSPSDTLVTVEFYAFCDNRTVSRLKFGQTIFILNQYPLYTEFPENLFNAPVVSPKFSETGFQTNRTGPYLRFPAKLDTAASISIGNTADWKTRIYILVRIVEFENRGSLQCQPGNAVGACNPVITVCFHKTLCKIVTEFNTNTLTDCNGDLVNINNAHHTSANTPNSTMLFSLPSYPGYLMANVYDEKFGTTEIASFNVTLDHVQVDSYFSGAFPNTLIERTGNVTLTLEVMAWCGKVNFGNQCGLTKPKAMDGTFRPACSNTTLCEHGGFCRDGKCICASGWTGPTCTVDIDECAIGACVNSLGCQNTHGSYICNCTEGFGGRNCDQDLNECDGSPCHNGSTCLNTFGSYTCFCATYWKGKDCKESAFCEQNVCNHSMTCTESGGDFHCNCSNGWTGKRCDQDIDECLGSPCSNTSTIECVNFQGSFTCRCKPGYEGNLCQVLNECKTLRPCQNGGRCYNVDSGHFCHCPPAWTGKDCTEPVDSCQKDPCKNNGTCLENRGGGFHCNCAKGWTGSFCTENIDECTVFGGDRLCNYHGTCTDTQGSFTCTCNAGWTGRFCNTDLLECGSDPCFNNGTCTNLPGGYSCSCVQGWTGPNCQGDFDECGDVSFCHNSGTCINLMGSFECVCNQGWDGLHCNLDINECESQTGACQNGGTCHNFVGGFNCTCATGWQGDLCTDDIDECSLYYPCFNSGTCINTNGGYSCNCTSAWKGVNCTENVNECSTYFGICGHGKCADTHGGYNCSCVLGWQGQNCLEDIDECINFDACSNYSVCINTLGDYQCQCVDGWTGRKCEVDIDECSSNPCQNGGTCLNRNAYYKCICPNGWDGLNCQTDINECSHNSCSTGQICHNEPGSYFCEPLTTTTISTEKTTIPSSTTAPITMLTLPTFTSSQRTKVATSGSTAAVTSKSFRPPSTSLTSVSTNNVPSSVDVFSLQFVSPVPKLELATVRNGIHDILKLLNCHDSTHIYVSLVKNSISNPKTVEFHAQCDGHHLTNEEINSAIRTLSKEKLLTYFPVALKQLSATPKEESWISSHIPIVGGVVGGVLLVIIVVAACVIYRKRQDRRYQKGEQTFVQEERLTDMDGKECVVIANPTYDSLYQRQTQA